MKQVWFGILAMICCFVPVQPATGRSPMPTGGVRLSVVINGDRDAKNIILYQNGVRLRREDFRARPDEGSVAVAITGSTLGMNYVASRTGDGRIYVDVSVLAGFDPQQSWFKETVRNVPCVLDHEQLHFDITALVACQLRKALVSTEFTPRNFQQELRQVLADYQHRWQEMENRYDEETVHGTNRAEQARWVERVRAGLVAEGGV